MTFSAWGPSFSSAAFSGQYPIFISNSVFFCHALLYHPLFSTIGLLLLLIFSSFSRHRQFILFLCFYRSDCSFHLSALIFLYFCCLSQCFLFSLSVIVSRLTSRFFQCCVASFFRISSSFSEFSFHFSLLLSQDDPFCCKNKVISEQCPTWTV